ncbi:MAG: ATP-binding protein [Rhodospirillales bacterium]
MNQSRKNPLETACSDLTGLPAFLQQRQAEHVLRKMPSFLTVNLVAIAVAGLFHGWTGATLPAAVWALAGLIITLLILVIWSRMRPHHNRVSLPARLTSGTIAVAGLTGLHWGAGGLLLIDSNVPENILFSVLVATVIGVVGAVTMAPCHRSVAALLLPAATGLMVPFISQPQTIPSAVMIAILFGLIALFAEFQRKSMRQTLRQDHQNRRLIDDLHQTRTQFQDAIESLPLGIMFFDESDRLILTNQQLKDYFPVVAPHLEPGISFFELLDHHVRSGACIYDSGMTAEETIRQRLEQHQNCSGTFEIQTIDGRILRGSDTREPNGRIMTVFSDITELRVRETELRHSRDRLFLVLDATEDGYWEVDLRREKSFWSRRFRAILGVENLALPATTFNLLALVHPGDRHFVETAFNRKDFSTARNFDLEYRVIRPDGNTVWIHDRGKAELDDQGNLIRMVGAAADITDRVNKIRERNAALDALERQNIELEQFVTIASHDLQEPLRMMTGYLDLLRRRSKATLDDEAQEYLDYSLQSGKRMQQLIRDLLDYSRIGTRGRPMENISLSDALEEARLNLSLIIQETGAEFELPDYLPEVTADHSQIVQLFQNLISNAMKYQREDQTPKIRIAVTDRVNEWVIRVIDNGIGIAPADQSRIFGIFQRLHGRSAYPGTGMGLAICRKIVERHDGRIWVESDISEGAAFCFTLPVVPDDLQDDAEAA